MNDEAALTSPVENPSPIGEETPRWMEQASLADLLLWRLGIPADRERIEREHDQLQKAIQLTPPITTRKVADAIAQLSLQLMEGKIDPTKAKTALYALQTLLTALRLQIVEEKKAKDAKKKKRDAPPLAAAARSGKTKSTRRNHANRNR